MKSRVGVVFNAITTVDHSTSSAYLIGGKHNILAELGQNRVLMADESHWGTETDKNIARIQHQINSPLNIDKALMESNNVYSLSVSATPLAEVGINTVGKVQIRLEP